jgi:hypothetical protein
MPTNKKVIIGGIIIVMFLIVFGGYWYMAEGNNQTAVPPTSDTSEAMETDNNTMATSDVALADVSQAETGQMEEDPDGAMDGERSYPDFMIDAWATADPGQNYILTFKADGRYTITLAEELEDKGTWYVKNNTVLYIESETDPDLSMSFDTVSTDDSGSFLFLTKMIGEGEIEYVFERTVTLDREAITGNWQTDGDFEEISLEADGTYATFLLDRPFDSGQWEFSNERLRLVSDAGEELNRTYDVSYGEATWELKLEMGGVVETWKHLP